MHLDGSLMLSCYIDSDFGGQFGSEDPGNPVSIKSRSGYLIKFGNVPVYHVCQENETRKVMFQNSMFETKDSEIENDNSKFETEEWTEVRRIR